MNMNYNVKKSVSQPDDVELCFSVTNTLVCRDLYIKPGVKTVIFDYPQYDMKSSVNSYPDVEKLAITSVVKRFEVNNQMFPNVKEIKTHNHLFYANGSALITTAEYNIATLINVFHLDEGASLDMKGVKNIAVGALDGCKTVDFINTQDTICVPPQNVLAGSEIERRINAGEYKNDVIMAGTLLFAINPNAEKISIPKNTTYIFQHINFSTAKEVTVSNFSLILASPYTFKKLIISDDIGIDRLDRNEMYTIDAEDIEIMQPNSKYVSVDGIVYSADMKRLVKCPRLKTGHINIPDGVEKIERYAFYKSHINSISFSDSLRNIGTSAFDSSKVREIDFGHGITKIGSSYSFADCNYLAEIKFPSQAKIISGSCFVRCKNLSSVILNDGLETIVGSAFEDCFNLHTITIPKTVHTIEKYAFRDVSRIIFEGRPVRNFIVSFAEFGEPSNARQINGYTVQVELSNGETVFVPKFMKFADIYSASDVLCNKDVSDSSILNFYMFASLTIAKQESAFKTFEKYRGSAQNELTMTALYAYCKRSSKSYALRAIEECNENAFAFITRSGLLSRPALFELKEIVIKNPVLLSYVLEALQKFTDKPKKTMRL